MSEARVVRVRDVMIGAYIRADGLETVQDAFLRLKRENARCIIVDRRDENDEYGIVVVADIAKKIIASDRSPARVNLYEIMSKPAVSVPPDMNIRYAARLFAQFGISIAPVIAGDEIEGIVTNNRIVLEGLSRIIEG